VTVAAHDIGAPEAGAAHEIVAPVAGAAHEIVDLRAAA
jgi:hypothetical protein